MAQDINFPEQPLVSIPESEVIAAANEGMDAFLKVFTNRYAEILGDEWTPERMALLNGSQMTLLVYSIFTSEVMDGGFVQLIHNGYGPLVFRNPFGTAVRQMGADQLATLLNKARRYYYEVEDEITKECTDEEFMAMFERYEKFDDMDDDFVMMEEEVTATLATYVDEHLDEFAVIVKD